MRTDSYATAIVETKRRENYQANGGDPVQFDEWMKDESAQRLWLTSGKGKVADGYLHLESEQGRDLTRYNVNATWFCGMILGAAIFFVLLMIVLSSR